MTKNWMVLLSLILAVGTSGCAWGPRGRTARQEEPLVLPGAVARAPAEVGWSISRNFDAWSSKFNLMGAGLRSEVYEEGDRPGSLEGEREALLAWQRATGAALLGDEAPEVSEIPFEVEPRFGPDAVVAVLRLEQRRSKAGLLVTKVVYFGQLVFRPPGSRDKVVSVALRDGGDSDVVTPDRFLAAFRSQLARVEPRAATPQALAEADARADDFPKQLHFGLAHRSLTLPQWAFQYGYRWERWLRPGDSADGHGLAFGLTDHLQLDAPGYLTWSFGESEARTRPEFAVGVGVSGIDHDALRGTRWGTAASLEARRRLGADVALHGLILGEQVHESRTGVDHRGHLATAGVVWEPWPLLSLGLEAGYRSSPWRSESTQEVWIGGRLVPLVTVHLLFLDLGLQAAAAWDHGRPGALAGFSVGLRL